MNVVIVPPAHLRGEIQIPGDKSISHRSVLLNAIAQGSASITGFVQSADCIASINALRALGVNVTLEQNGSIVVHGAGMYGLKEPSQCLNVGNSGTTMRLLTGILAGRDMLAVITGDSSLCGRPMGRVIDPLTAMGARIFGRRGNRNPPVVLNGGALKPMRHTTQAASAQVKSALLLTGLRANGTTEVVQPQPTRDHTERMLKAMGVPVISDGPVTAVTQATLNAVDVQVPGDISSAVFWMVAAAIHPNAELTLKRVGLNQSRTGAIDILRQMNANFTIHNLGDIAGELIADIVVKTSTLKATQVSGSIIPRLIDEIPVLAVAAAYAEGKTTFDDVQELRFKECDRIDTTVKWLTRAGVPCEEWQDGFSVSGVGHIQSGNYCANSDHRIAMSMSVAGFAAEQPITIEGAEVASVSYPMFWQHAEQVGAILQ